MTSILKQNTPFLVDDVTNQIVGVKNADGSETLFGGGGGGLASILPLAEASGIVTRCEKRENVSGFAGTTFVLMDTTGRNKPGVVSSIFVVTDGVAPVRDGVLYAYVDGESTPSVQFQLHNLGTLNQENSQAFGHSRIQISRGRGNHCHIVFKYPIPYKTSIRLQLGGPNGPNDFPGGIMFTNITYHENATLPWKLKTSSVGFQNRLQNQGKTQFENRAISLLDRPAGQAGFIAGVSMTFMGTNINAALENNIVVYGANQARDGTADPFYNTSGGEDFFNDSFYFENLNRGNTQWKYTVFPSTMDPTIVTAHNDIIVVHDFLDHIGGIAYADGAYMTFERGTAASPGDMGGLTLALMYCIWYYEPNP